MNKENIINELKVESKITALETNIKNLERENLSLKGKIDALRADNNSYLYSALVKFQAEMPIVIKNSTVYGKQKYASFADIKRLATPILSKYGLFVGQDLTNVEGSDGRAREAIKTFVCHASGQCRESVFIVPVFIDEKTQNPRNEIGGTLSYFQRRAFSSSLGIVTADED